MVRRVRAADLPVVIYDVSEKATADLAAGDTGVRIAATPAEVAEHSDIVCVVVQDDAQAEAVLLGEGGALRHARSEAVIVVHSTLSLAAIRRLSAAAEEHDLPLLDAGVSGKAGEHSAARGELAVMVGGSREAFDRARPVLNCYAGLAIHLGPSGCGMRAKLARNAICYQSYVALFEGLFLADAAGVDRAAMEQILEYTGLNSEAMQSFLAHRKGVGRFEPGSEQAALAEFNAGIGRKDLTAVVALGRELGVSLPGVEAGKGSMRAVFGAFEPE